MSSPLPPLPGETPEQRQARLNAAYEVQARIDAERRAELEAREQARRREMQAQIDRMLRTAYVLPPLPQLPTPVIPERQQPVILAPPPPPMKTYYDPEPPLPTPVVPPRLTPVMPPAPVVAPPELRPPASTPMETLSSAIQNASAFVAPRNTDYSQPTQPSLGMSSLLAPQPALPAAYTPPMEAPVPSFNLGDLGGGQDAFQNPPSMRLGAGMPRMDYAQNFYAVNPNEVAMYKMGGLAVKPKKGKC